VPELNHTFIIGAALAFLLAVVTVLYDCNLAVKDKLKRVPMLIFRVPQAIALSLLCGLTAAVAFSFTNGKGDTLIDSVLGLKQPDAILRGAIVGLTVLVLIRSKISSFRGAELGGELAYNSGRTGVMRALNRKWRAYKSNFNRLNLTTALDFADYHTKVVDQLRDSLKTEPEDFRTFVESQISNVQHNKPAAAFDKTSAEWQSYYSTLTNLALDYSGPEVFEGWIQFKDPRKFKERKNP
jgi:hypothetical protein